MPSPAQTKAQRDAAIDRKTIRVVAPVIAVLTLGCAVFTWFAARREAVATGTPTDYSGTLVLLLMAVLAGFISAAEFKREQVRRQIEEHAPENLPPDLRDDLP